MASTTLTELEWQNSELIEGDVPDGVRALKAQDGPELQVHGSANLLQTLIEHGLVDEFRLWTFPLVLGKGKRLFDGGTAPAGLELASSQVSSTGVTMATTEPAPRSSTAPSPPRRRARPSRRAAPRRTAEVPGARARQSGSSSRLTSSAGAECVSAPTLMKSTPVSATARMVSSVIPPDASSDARGRRQLRPPRAARRGPCCRAAAA